MKVNGLVVNEQAIADSLYAIIVEAGEEAIVAFGMIPKWIMDISEKMIREKVVAIAAEQKQVSVAEFTPYIDEKLLKDTVQPIVSAIATGIYGAAKRAGRMVV